MNILHLKYAVEIAKTGSLNKAAENLYMGQPNLSRAIRELEDRERQIIVLRYFKDMTQQQIAGILGISQVQVSRIEKKVLERMRAKMMG